MEMEVYLLFEHAVLGVNPVLAFLISPTELTVDYFYNFLFGVRPQLKRFLLAASKIEMERDREMTIEMLRIEDGEELCLIVRAQGVL